MVHDYKSLKFPQLKLPLWVLIKIRRHMRNRDPSCFEYLCTSIKSDRYPESIEANRNAILKAISDAVHNIHDCGRRAKNHSLAGKVIELNPEGFHIPVNGPIFNSYFDNPGALRIAWLDVEIDRMWDAYTKHNEYKYIVFPKLDMEYGMLATLQYAYTRYLTSNPNDYFICHMLRECNHGIDIDRAMSMLNIISKTLDGYSTLTSRLNRDNPNTLGSFTVPEHQNIRLHWLTTELRRVNGEKDTEIPRLVPKFIYRPDGRRGTVS